MLDVAAQRVASLSWLLPPSRRQILFADTQGKIRTFLAKLVFGLLILQLLLRVISDRFMISQVTPLVSIEMASDYL